MVMIHPASLLSEKVRSWSVLFLTQDALFRIWKLTSLSYNCRCAIADVSSTPQTRYHDTGAAEGNMQIDIYFTPTESGVNEGLDVFVNLYIGIGFYLIMVKGFIFKLYSNTIMTKGVIFIFCHNMIMEKG